MNNNEAQERLWELVQEVHQRMNNDDQFKRIFADQRFDLEYRVTDLDMVLTVQVDRGQVSLSRAESDNPAIIMEMNASYFHAMCHGSIVVPLAILSKRIKMHMRNRDKAAGAFPLTAITQRVYKQVCQEFNAAGKWTPT